MFAALAMLSDVHFGDICEMWWQPARECIQISRGAWLSATGCTSMSQLGPHLCASPGDTSVSQLGAHLWHTWGQIFITAGGTSVSQPWGHLCVTAGSTSVWQPWGHIYVPALGAHLCHSWGHICVPALGHICVQPGGLHRVPVSLSSLWATSTAVFS